ncbi:sigma-70 family RNA polymerase sigma factor [Clostridium sp. SHJSY1]|uniref:sigma-70 family RNA polymerase sigma factor n=1 Tax=Clostridium sp. SHJSY1 TaxID=2942483 RepID=UPI002876B16F|nr:sigma-70 family RNA polymerase sigma factor [Clostridium sp. SHJSY1]MDS0526245.1 sigma-70 family RNA polymerase sigma factor [Clostridium sp. SHJSY1]
MNVEEQVKLAIKGDKKSFEYLIDINKEGLYRTAFAYVKNEQDALDILQDTVYKAYISIDKLKEPKYFKTWLTRILINNSINFINKTRKIVYITDDMKSESGYCEGNKIDEKLDMLSSIDKLEEKCKTVILLKYFQDLTIAEISEVLDCPIGTIKTYLNKGLNKLRVFMNEEIV